MYGGLTVPVALQNTRNMLRVGFTAPRNGTADFIAGLCSRHILGCKADWEFDHTVGLNICSAILHRHDACEFSASVLQNFDDLPFRRNSARWDGSYHYTVAYHCPHEKFSGNENLDVIFFTADKAKSTA